MTLSSLFTRRVLHLTLFGCQGPLSYLSVGLCRFRVSCFCPANGTIPSMCLLHLRHCKIRVKTPRLR